MTVKLRGSLVALVTPFRDGKVDEEALRRLVRWHLKQETNGLVPCGTTGEAATLTPAEFDQVVGAVVEEVRQAGRQGTVPVVAGTGSNSTAATIERTKRARELGVDAALVVTPYYNKPTQEGLYRHYAAVVREAHHPVVVYNVPGRTAANILPDTVARLAELELIVGVKEASGNLDQITEVVRRVGDRMAVLSGDDGLNFPIACVGGVGAISVLANLVPADCARLFWEVDNGKLRAGRELHHRYQRLVRALFIETNPIPVKTALGMMGRLEPEFRLPLCPMSDQNLNRLNEVLADYGLLKG